ncbi:hypothetical protein HZH66_004253 [Vespula vulgaris]|uniref:Uncharacterized protein n=2 Tax=Vespula TaxID=7451 RepID=A0A834P8L9_VESPE|nr:hypothetical protein HZH66_004253 [Vespula vulgaris]KAF7432252.1 hypothetical protein H0235_005176 [Vespula pensylvanica]
MRYRNALPGPVKGFSFNRAKVLRDSTESPAVGTRCGRNYRSERSNLWKRYRVKVSPLGILKHRSDIVFVMINMKDYTLLSWNGIPSHHKMKLKDHLRHLSRFPRNINVQNVSIRSYQGVRRLCPTECGSSIFNSSP